MKRIFLAIGFVAMLGITNEVVAQNVNGGRGTQNTTKPTNKEEVRKPNENSQADKHSGRVHNNGKHLGHEKGKGHQKGKGKGHDKHNHEGHNHDGHKHDANQTQQTTPQRGNAPQQSTKPNSTDRATKPQKLENK